jgi:hypothetical protein
MPQAVARVPRRASARINLRQQLEQAVEAAIAALDALDGDADLEPAVGAPESPCARFAPSRFSPEGRVLGRLRPGDQRHWAEGGDCGEREDLCEDEGAQCDDEGVSGYLDPDREPDADAEPDNEHEACHWQDEGDQTRLIPHGVYLRRRARLSVHTNVGAFIPVRAL